MRVACVILLGLGSVALAQPPVAPEPRPAPDRAAGYVRDLKLTATAGERTVKADELPRVTLTLENTSKTQSYFVVKAGDGSEAGWREPHVYFTAEQQWQGKWEAIPSHGVGRCGLYSNEWWKDVVELKPGGKLVVAEMAYPTFRMPTDGKLRLTGHYAYRGGMNKSFQQPPERRGAMGATAAFSITSNAVEFDVVRPNDGRPRSEQP